MRQQTGQESRALLPLSCFTLFGFAVCQPLFDLLGRNPIFLLEHAAGWRELAWLVASSWLVPGLACAALLLLARLLSPLLERALFALIFLPLVAAMFSPLLPGPPWAVLAAASLVAAAGLWAAFRIRAFRVALAVGAAAPLVFSVIFLLRPAVRGVVDPPRPPGAMEFEANAPLRSIILVVLDEVPTVSLLSGPNEIDRERFPNFAALRDDSVWFRNCATASGATERSVPAILTGRLVNGTATPDLEHYPENLITLLAHDMLVVAQESVTHLSPPEFKRLDPNSRAHSMELLLSDSGVLLLHRVLPKEWARRIPQIDTGWAAFGRTQDAGGGRPGKFLDWVQRLRRGFKPTLGVLHLVFPHNPYVYYPDGTQFSDRGVEPFKFGGRWIDDEEVVQQTWQRSLLQLELADRLLGRLMDRLRELDLYDDAVIAVTADHGVSFRPGEFFRRITPQSAGDLAAVPWFLKLPGQRRAGVLDERLVSTVDILPTVAEAAGFSVPWELDGRSYLDPATEGRETSAFFDIEEAEVERRLSLEDLGGQFETLRRQRALFAANPWATSVGPHAALVGRPLDQLEVAGPSGLRVRVDDPPRAANTRPGSRFLPGELRGTLVADAAMTAPVDLAVVLRDSVAAVTRSVHDGRPTRAAEWLALLPQQRARQGRSGLRIFAIDEVSRLHAIERTGAPPTALGQRLGLQDVEGVQLRGILQESGHKGERGRWTLGEASLAIPMARGEEARRLRVAIARTAVPGARVRIAVAGEVVFDGPLDESPFEREFSFALDADVNPVVVELQCEPTESDEAGRQRGLLLRGVWLDE